MLKAKERRSAKLAETEEGKNLKVVRKNKLSIIKRKANNLQTLLTGTASSLKLHNAFEGVTQGEPGSGDHVRGEHTHGDEEVLACEGDYLFYSANTFAQMDLKVSMALEAVSKLVTDSQQKANYDSALASLNVNVKAFGKPSAMRCQLIGEQRISF